MAKVFFDPHMFGTDWFRTALTELQSCKDVFFVYGGCKTNVGERERARKALQFYKLAGMLRCKKGNSRRIDVDKSDLEHHITALRENHEFISCPDCDDAHIFALVFLKAVPYVFSQDKRIPDAEK